MADGDAVVDGVEEVIDLCGVVEVAKVFGIGESAAVGEDVPGFFVGAGA